METRSHDIRAIFLDRNPGAADGLAKKLQPDVILGEVDFTNTTHKAVQHFSECQYHICFVAETFQSEELQLFFRDVAKVLGAKSCVFIQVRDRVEQELDRHALKDLGFTFIISRDGTHTDRSGVKDALKALLYEQKVDEKVIDVSEAMPLVLAEIDRAAENIKRGGAAHFNKLPIWFVGFQTTFDRRVLDEYFQQLSENTEQSPPNEVDRIDVPLNILTRRLPHLDQERYTGVSRRVWERLKKKYGKKYDPNSNDTE